MNINALLVKALGWIIAAVIAGGVGWATWVSTTLYEIKIAVGELKSYEQRIERLEASVWPDIWRN